MSQGTVEMLEERADSVIEASSNLTDKDGFKHVTRRTRKRNKHADTINEKVVQEAQPEDSDPISAADAETTESDSEDVFFDTSSEPISEADSHETTSEQNLPSKSEEAEQDSTVERPRKAKPSNLFAGLEDHGSELPEAEDAVQVSRKNKSRKRRRNKKATTPPAQEMPQATPAAAIVHEVPQVGPAHSVAEYLKPAAYWVIVHAKALLFVFCVAIVTRFAWLQCQYYHTYESHSFI